MLHNKCPMQHEVAPDQLCSSLRYWTSKISFHNLNSALLSSLLLNNIKWNTDAVCFCKVSLLLREGEPTGHRCFHPEHNWVNHEWDAKWRHDSRSICWCFLSQYYAIYTVPETKRWHSWWEVWTHQGLTCWIGPVQWFVLGHVQRLFSFIFWVSTEGPQVCVFVICADSKNLLGHLVRTPIHYVTDETESILNLAWSFFQALHQKNWFVLQSQDLNSSSWAQRFHGVVD